jgi:hypothetical protein
MRFLTELRCEKLRPQLFRLTENLDYQDPTPAAVAIKVLLQRSLLKVRLQGRAKVTSRVVPHRLQDGERLNLRIGRAGVSVRAASSQDDRRTGGQALACRRSFWRCSARSRGTRPRSSEPERGSVVSVQAAAALAALPRPAAPQVGSPAQQAPAAADPVAAADRVAAAELAQIARRGRACGAVSP